MYDIGIIGAGPCGISCALKSSKNHKSVLVIECGNNYDKRYCAIDHGDVCNDCYTCNVISGFGGCVHYEDSLKLSYYPSGRALHDKLNKDYNRIRDEACFLWGVKSNDDFRDNKIELGKHNFCIKNYPVCVVSNREVKARLEAFWKDMALHKIDYYNARMIDFVKEKDCFHVYLDDKKSFDCRVLVLAMGRFGIRWLKDNLSRKNIIHDLPISSMGFRFEMPKELLNVLGYHYPDFKARIQYNNVKYKTFCFCSGSNGGRLKFWKHGKYSLLDGHINTKDDVGDGFANFALLRQIITPTGYDGLYDDYIRGILDTYYEISKGRPIFQSYSSFKSNKSYEYKQQTSKKFIKPGPVYKLINNGINDYCKVTEEIFRYIAEINGLTVDELINSVNVIGLELEGLWNKVRTNDWFMTNMEGLYIGGDCAGETQGILQATMAGIRIAEGIV